MRQRPPNRHKLSPSPNKRKEPRNEQRAPDPNNSHCKPRLKKAATEYILRRIHRQRPENPMAYEGRDAPICCDARPALEMELRAWRSGLFVQFLRQYIINSTTIAFRAAEG